MSTHCWICQEQPDGTVRGIYCHFDGYPMYVGRILCTHYQDPKKVGALIDLGGISTLMETVEDTVAYYRDRGEPVKNISVWKNFEDFLLNVEEADFAYCQFNTEWYFNEWEGEGWRPIKSFINL